MKNLSAFINSTIEYIIKNLEENITAESVAEHFHISRSYFSRLFKAETGESVYAFIKKKKLEFSAILLKSQEERNITDVATSFGYSSSNYSTAFRLFFDKSPVEFRAERLGAHNERIDPSNEAIARVYDEIARTVRIEDLPEYDVVYERYIDNYGCLKTLWERFCSRYDRFATPQTIFFERTYDDPTLIDKNTCLFDIAMSCEGLIGRDDIPPSASFGRINGGKFAICLFHGYLGEIPQFHDKLMNLFLPLSGHSLSPNNDFVRFCHQ